MGQEEECGGILQKPRERMSSQSSVGRGLRKHQSVIADGISCSPKERMRLNSQGKENVVQGCKTQVRRMVLGHRDNA